MTAFLYKFTTTQTQQNGALNRMLAEIRSGFNQLYADFGGDLGDAIQAELPNTPISVGLNVGNYSADTRPDDTGNMAFTYTWGEFTPAVDPNSPEPENPDFIQISTPGFWCDLLADLGGTTVDPNWFDTTLQQRWNRGNRTTRACTAEQQAINGGQTEIELVSSGDAQTWLSAPEFGRHSFAGIPNRVEPPPEVIDTDTKPGRKHQRTAQS